MGEVDLADPDLSESMASLVQAKPPGDLHSKLIIPDEQIKYLSIPTPGMDAQARRAAARVALDGATPYPVDALAFDTSPDGDTTHVAAVARETLLEAEAFATEHGFNPVSFVGAAQDAAFLGEPFFGPTAVAATLLPPGVKVEPDGVRVVIVDRPTPGPTPTPSDPHPSVADTSTAPASATPPPAPTNQPPVAAPTITPSAEQADSGTPPVSDPLVLAAASASAPPGTPPAQDALAPRDTGATAPPPLLGFATRRRQNPDSDAAPVRLGGVSRSTTSSRPSPAEPKVIPAKRKDPPNLTAPAKSISDSLRPTPAIQMPQIPEAPQMPADSGSDPRETGFLSRRTAPLPDLPAPPPIAPSATRRADDGIPHSETQRMTVFGARDTQIVGGKPRFLGLILMAILLVFLAGVAAWATVFLDEGLARWLPQRERTLASTLPDDAEDTLSADVGLTTDLERDAEQDADEDIVVAALNDSLSAEDGLTAEDTAVLDALRDPLPDPVAPEELDAAALEARYAVTGIWLRVPEMGIPADPVDIEDLYVTGIDPVSPALDAVALPGATSFDTDGQLAVVTSPLAAGTNFARGPDGRVIATPEGALSPDGFRVILGRPPVEPPAILARLDTGPETEARQNAQTQVRPQPRPTDLIEQNERATLGGLSRSELAALRPRLRPQGPQDVQPTQEPTPQTVATQDQQPQDSTPPSDLAAAISLRPETRPRNFDRLVARAVPAAPQPQPEAQPRAAPEPVAPRTASVAPRAVTPAIPSATSVARAATVDNAINLRQANLIGVYGTPSSRRALIRLGNGRYQKVEVGDRFDGGRVSAIGDSELRYQKGNRNLILRIPNG